jgi:5-methylcytosine-specific restriction protein A
VNTARPSARARGYNHRWDKARITFLRRRPLCVMCEKQGRVTAAQVVDHIIPHKGDQALFWDTANWQPLCTPHHNRDKQSMERGGEVVTIGVDGWPTG